MRYIGIAGKNNEIEGIRPIFQGSISSIIKSCFGTSWIMRKSAREIRFWK